MKFICACSGISSPTQAWGPLGFEALAYAEIDPFASAVLAHRFGAGRPRFMPRPEDTTDPKEQRRRSAAIKALDRVEWGAKIPNEGDFTRLRDERFIGEAEVLVGGTPCQDFSLAGLRAGLSGDRGNLSLEFIRLADAIDDLRRADGREPAFVLWENVPGVFSVGGNAFGCFLAGLVGASAPLVPPGKRGWTDSGVVAGPKRVAAWRVLNAQHFGLPQRRRRVFVLARGGPRAWAVADALLPIIDGMRGHPAPGQQSRQGASAGLGGDASPEGGGAAQPVGRGVGPPRSGGGVGPGRVGRDDVRAFGGNRTSGELEVGTALSAHGGPKGRIDFETETFVVEPVPFDTTQITHPENRSNPKPGDPAPTLAKSGHAPAIAFRTDQTGANGLNIGQDVAFPLDLGTPQGVLAPDVSGPILAGGSDGAGPRTTDIESGALVVAFSSKDDGGDAGELAPTLRAMNHDGSHANAGGQVAVAFSMRGRAGENMCEPEADDVAPAIRTAGGGSSTPMVAVAFQERGRDGERSLETSDVAYALTAPTGGTRRQEKLVAYNVTPETGGSFGGRAKETDVAPALTAVSEKARNGRGLHIVQAEAFKPSHYTRDKDGAPSDAAPALSADADKGDQEAVLHVVRADGIPDVAAAMTAAGGTSRKHGQGWGQQEWEGGYAVPVFAPDVAGTLTSASTSPAAHGKVNGTDRSELVVQSAVRRLTCRECERLQGMADDFTLIPWATSSKRDERDLEETVAYLMAAGYGGNEARVLAETPDGPRYRVLGNSMARNVVEELGRRILWAAAQ